MAIKNFLNNKTEDLGSSNPVICPSCGKETALQLFTNYDTNNYIGKILGKDKEYNFAVCPLCAGVFKINMSAYGVQNSTLHDYNLIPIKSDKKDE